MYRACIQHVAGADYRACIEHVGSEDRGEERPGEEGLQQLPLQLL